MCRLAILQKCRLKLFALFLRRWFNGNIIKIVTQQKRLIKNKTKTVAVIALIGELTFKICQQFSASTGQLLAHSEMESHCPRKIYCRPSSCTNVKPVTTLCSVGGRQPTNCTEPRPGSNSARGRSYPWYPLVGRAWKLLGRVQQVWKRRDQDPILFTLRF